MVMHVTSSSMETLSDKQWDPEEDAPPRTKQPQQRGPVDPDAEMTLLHELGHHVSAQTGRRSAEYRTPAQRGREEGFADSFMMSRYREDPRNVHWRGRTDPRKHSYLARGQLEKFGEEGHAASGPAQYREELGRENRPPVDDYLSVMGNVGQAIERRERPMLDEFLPEHQQVFTQHIKGWSSPGDEPEEKRKGVYKKAAQRTNVRRMRAEQARGGGSVEIKGRWGVSRNLGRQF
jgi:hypothetical protein